MKLLLFCILLHIPPLYAPSVLQSGIGSTNTEEGNAELIKSCYNKKCYFQFFQTTDLETKERPKKSVVSNGCTNELISFGDLMNHPVDQNTGADNSLALVICRGTGVCNLDFSNQDVVDEWKNRMICEHHASELLYKWGSRDGFQRSHLYRDSEDNIVCSMPEEIGTKHKRRPHEKLHILTTQEAHMIIQQLGFLVHPGIPICRSHQEFVSKLTESQNRSPRKRARLQEGYFSDIDDASCSSDTNFINPSPKIKRTHAGSALREFADFVGVDRVCFPSKKFDELSQRSQQKKVCSARKLFDAMVGVMAGEDDADRLKKKVLQKLEDDESWTTGSSENFENVMRQITAQFMTAYTKKQRITVLSVVANSIPYLTVAKHIPNLSRYMYNDAKVFARRNDIDKFESPKKQSERYNRVAVELFIDFITSPSIMIGLPYGSRNVKLSDGTKQQIPDTIRQQSSTEIFEMYSRMLKNTDQKDLELSRSSVFRILDVCAATDRKATTCVDYFTANGMEGFDGLQKIVDEWIESESSHVEIFKQMKKELFEASQYLRTDFRLHVKKCSRVADHCATLALSDPNDKKMASSCSTGSYQHKYDLRCDRCERAKSVLNEISTFAKDRMSEIPKSEALWQKRKEEYDLVEKYVDEIQEMKKHYLRAAYTSQEREDILNNLSDNAALVTIDFAQKYLPRWHREKQNDYFGKKGISYHISHVAAKVGGKYTQHSFVHVFDGQVTQDSSLVVLTLLHVLSQLKKVGITKVSIRSDNAGSYHCANTINSLHYLMEETGVQIETYTFSEAQNGKSSSDRDASRVKRKAEEYVSKGHDITTSAEFFESLKEGKLLNGMSIHHGSVTVDVPGNAKWTGISNLNHFTVEKDGIRGRRYGGMGDGQFVKKGELNPMNGTYEFEDAGYIAADVDSVETETSNVVAGKKTKFWYHPECISKKEKSSPNIESASCIEEADDSLSETDGGGNAKMTEEIGKLYACPEVGCSSQFLTHYNLENHILRGKHRISPERFTLRDAAFKMFARNIEEIQNSRSCSAISDALNELKETKEQDSLKIGWALPRKQTRKPFETHVKKFLISCFEEGLLKKRLDPKFVEKRMITEKNEDGSLKFTVEERKDFRQIAGFFSREAEKRRSAGAHRHRRYIAPEDEVYMVPEDEHDDAGLIRFMKDESFFTESDEFFQAVQDAKELFIY